MKSVQSGKPKFCVELKGWDMPKMWFYGSEDAEKAYKCFEPGMVRYLEGGKEERIERVELNAWVKDGEYGLKWKEER